MFLKSKKLAFLGLLLACTVLLIIFGSIWESSTLFLLAGASFCVGIAIRESGLTAGVCFYLASILLSLILAPNKLYCITYSAMGLYIVISELAFDRLAYIHLKNRKAIYWLIKYAAFNIMYLPILFLFPQYIYQGKISRILITVFLIGGQLLLLVYDVAYNYFQRYLWSRLRRNLHF